MIIGISGLAGSGKDTAADSLVLGHGYVKLSFADPLKRIARDVYGFTETQLWGSSDNRNAPDFRYPRTEYAREWQAAWNASERRQQIDVRDAIVEDFGESYGAHFLTPRHALQQLGTEWGRTCYPETWSAMGIRLAQELDGAQGKHYDAKKGIFACSRPPIEGVAIPDVRFWNEVDAVKKAGGKVIRVKRAGAGLKDATGALHKSETEMACIADAVFDAVIENDGSLQELHDKVGEVLTSFRP